MGLLRLAVCLVILNFLVTLIGVRLSTKMVHGSSEWAHFAEVQSFSVIVFSPCKLIQVDVCKLVVG